MTRQQKWQDRQRAQGKCIRCGAPRRRSGWYCDRHLYAVCVEARRRTVKKWEAAT